VDLSFFSENFEKIEKSGNEEFGLEIIIV